MGENTKVTWCHHSFNGWWGCVYWSDGCINCYAEMWDKRVGYTPEGWGRGKPRRRTSEANWRQPLIWNRKAQESGERHRVFANSMSDVFDAEVPDQWRDDLFELIEQTPYLDWLILTKRAVEMKTYFSHSVPLSNVWLGVSVENQKRADERLPELIALREQVPVLFVSYEPALDYVDFGRWTDHLDWIIVGGESGPKARPFQMLWAYTAQGQSNCCFVKQMGSNPFYRPGAPWILKDPKGEDPKEWPKRLRVRQFPTPRKVNQETVA